MCRKFRREHNAFLWTVTLIIVKTAVDNVPLVHLPTKDVSYHAHAGKQKSKVNSQMSMSAVKRFGYLTMVSVQPSSAISLVIFSQTVLANTYSHKYGIWSIHVDFVTTYNMHVYGIVAEEICLIITAREAPSSVQNNSLYKG